MKLCGYTYEGIGKPPTFLLAVTVMKILYKCTKGILPYYALSVTHSSPFLKILGSHIGSKVI